jgi:hypothetical protein
MCIVDLLEESVNGEESDEEDESQEPRRGRRRQEKREEQSFHHMSILPWVPKNVNRYSQ